MKPRAQNPKSTGVSPVSVCLGWVRRHEDSTLPCVDRFRAGDFPSKQTPSQDGLAPISRHPAAYVLLEIIIALTIFAVVVTGLAGLLHSTLDGANELRRQAAMRRGLESILVEAREKPKREEMALATRDDALGVEFRSALEEVKWINRKGQPVKGLWLLTASATDLRDGNTVRDRAEVYVYRP